MKTSARLISFLFHPILFPTFGTLLILAANPNRYGYFGDKLHIVWLIIVFALTFVFPAVWLLMMKRLEMIESLALSTTNERIIPFIATATFYLWTAWMFKPHNVNMKISPNEMVFYMMLGSCFCIFLALVINIFGKISLHAAAAGNLLGLTFILINSSTYDLRFFLIGAIVLAGIIGTARLILSAHTPREIYWGYFIGFSAQFLAFTFVPKLF